MSQSTHSKGHLKKIIEIEALDSTAIFYSKDSTAIRKDYEITISSKF